MHSLRYLLQWSERFVSPELTSWNPDTQVLVLGGGAVGRCSGHEWGALMDGASGLLRDPRAFHGPPYFCRKVEWKGALTSPRWHPDLELPSLQTVRSNFLLFLSYSACAALFYSQKELRYLLMPGFSVGWGLCFALPPKVQGSASSLVSSKYPLTLYILSVWIIKTGGGRLWGVYVTSTWPLSPDSTQSSLPTALS